MLEPTSEQLKISPNSFNPLADISSVAPLPTPASQLYTSKPDTPPVYTQADDLVASDMPADTHADPGCLDDDSETWVESETIGPDHEPSLDAIFEGTKLEDLRVAAEFIKALQLASLNDKHNQMDDKSLH